MLKTLVRGTTVSRFGSEFDARFSVLSTSFDQGQEQLEVATIRLSKSPASSKQHIRKHIKKEKDSSNKEANQSHHHHHHHYHYHHHQQQQQQRGHRLTDMPALALRINVGSLTCPTSSPQNVTITITITSRSEPASPTTTTTGHKEADHHTERQRRRRTGLPNSTAESYRPTTMTTHNETNKTFRHQTSIVDRRSLSKLC